MAQSHQLTALCEGGHFQVWGKGFFDDQGVDVVLDWEHTEYRWIEPGELVDFDTVVSLQRTLEAALDSKLA